METALYIRTCSWSVSDCIDPRAKVMEEEIMRRDLGFAR